MLDTEVAARARSARDPSNRPCSLDFGPKGFLANFRIRSRAPRVASIERTSELAESRSPVPDDERDGFLIVDGAAGVEIVTGSLEVKENVKLT